MTWVLTGTHIMVFKEHFQFSISSWVTCIIFTSFAVEQCIITKLISVSWYFSVQYDLLIISKNLKKKKLNLAMWTWTCIWLSKFKQHRYNCCMLFLIHYMQFCLLNGFFCLRWCLRNLNNTVLVYGKSLYMEKHE
jgi:hypothetical protein